MARPSSSANLSAGRSLAKGASRATPRRASTLHFELSLAAATASRSSSGRGIGPIGQAPGPRPCGPRRRRTSARRGPRPSDCRRPARRGPPPAPPSAAPAACCIAAITGAGSVGAGCRSPPRPPAPRPDRSTCSNSGHHLHALGRVGQFAQGGRSLAADRRRRDFRPRSAARGAAPRAPRAASARINSHCTGRLAAGAGPQAGLAIAGLRRRCRARLSWSKACCSASCVVDHAGQFRA